MTSVRSFISCDLSASTDLSLVLFPWVFRRSQLG